MAEVTRKEMIDYIDRVCKKVLKDIAEYNAYVDRRNRANPDKEPLPNITEKDIWNDVARRMKNSGPDQSGDAAEKEAVRWTRGDLPQQPKGE